MEKITVETNIKYPIKKVWEFWSLPEHITKWNFATDEWYCPKAENNFIESGKFNWRMEAKDGSMGFDYCGTYNKIIKEESIELTLDDGRKVSIKFDEIANTTKVTETFEVEDENTKEQQRFGWQSILNNFKKYVEQN